MSRSLNKVQLIGNLTRNPELKYTPSGSAYCTFGIATNREWKVDGENKQQTDYHNIVAWQKLGELCAQLLKKGTKVFVEGRIQNREWDGQDGQKVKRTEIVIEDMIILDSKKGSSDNSSQSNQDDRIPEEVNSIDEINTDDLPF
ncbi:single-stranded DNA-binding protein [bacterium]|jgi:single-strand DNA-binding protein|nr:single-stranded DNA-binding protein [bacterium]